ncbi:MAG: sigma 54-interacting transcriptional regulator, partial [Myxococcales bacterium]|nr:sigma 54-interacting transcriptional regulator [Myxococcales bacterium]
MSSELDATTMDASAPRAKAPLEPMIHLIWSAGRLRSDHLRDLPPELVLGRAPGEGGLALPEDHQASRRHARFLRRGRDVSVEDLGSRNGTFVNGERVSRTPLVDRDVVRIGSTLLVFRLEDPRQLDVPNELLVGRSQEIRQVRIAVQRYAKSSDTVLVVGETGTGKELVAQALHRVGKRPGELVAVNCAAIQAALAESVLFGHVAGAFTGARGDAEGFFRAAGRGTLLLDEVGDMAP